MSVPNWLQRSAKNKARSAVIEQAPFQCNNVLLLPGREMLCFWEMIDRGRIVPQTRCIFVERDREIAEHIANEMKAIRFLTKKPVILQGELHDVDLYPYMKNNKFDFAYFDICGTITKKLAIWLAAFRFYKKGSVLAFTTENVMRVCDYVKKDIPDKLGGKVNPEVISQLAWIEAPWLVGVDKDTTNNGIKNAFMTTQALMYTMGGFGSSEIVASEKHYDNTPMLSTVLRMTVGAPRYEKTLRKQKETEVIGSTWQKKK
jgi:hypothetical protein